MDFIRLEVGFCYCFWKQGTKRRDNELKENEWEGQLPTMEGYDFSLTGCQIPLWKNAKRWEILPDCTMKLITVLLFRKSVIWHWMGEAAVCEFTTSIKIIAVTFRVDIHAGSGTQSNLIKSFRLDIWQISTLWPQLLLTKSIIILYSSTFKR